MSEACLSETEWIAERIKLDIAPSSIGDKSSRIYHAARKLGWKPSRAKDAWYADVRRTVHPRELRKVEQITGKKYGAPELQEVDELTARALSLLDGADAYPSSTLAAAMRAFISTLVSAGTGDDANQ